MALGEDITPLSICGIPRCPKQISAGGLQNQDATRVHVCASSPVLVDDCSMTIKLGLCGFTMGAAVYYRQFSVVEVQQTSYDPPALPTMEKWRAQAPLSFEFTMKAWEVITHFSDGNTYGRLRRTFGDRERAEAGGFRLNATTLGDWETTLAAARVARDRDSLSVSSEFQSYRRERYVDARVLRSDRAPRCSELAMGASRSAAGRHRSRTMCERRRNRPPAVNAPRFLWASATCSYRQDCWISIPAHHLA